MMPRDPIKLRALAPPEDLKLRVLAAARGHPAPARTDGFLRGLSLTALAAVAMVAVLALAGGPSHATGRPAVSGAWIVAGTLALAVSATWFSLPHRRSMLSPARGQLLAVAIGVPVLVGAWLLLWHGTHDDPLVGNGYRCFALTAATAPWPFIALAYFSRRLDPRHPALAGAALGATAGTWAAVMVELWCPFAVVDHVVIGHVLPLAFLALAGSVYGARKFGLRRVRLSTSARSQSARQW
jgi:hypothetical protein